MNITITDKAANYMGRMVRFNGGTADSGFRLVVSPGGCLRFQLQLHRGGCATVRRCGAGQQRRKSIPARREPHFAGRDNGGFHRHRHVHRINVYQPERAVVRVQQRQCRYATPGRHDKHRQYPAQALMLRKGSASAEKLLIMHRKYTGKNFYKVSAVMLMRFLRVCER